MSPRSASPATVEEYIARFPSEVQALLVAIRTTIRKAAPDAEEQISYQIPTFKLKGHLLSYAAFANHIGLYPAPSGTAAFNRKLSPYRTGKSTVRLPLDRALPLDLITEIVELRVQDNLRRAAARTKRR